jgi:(S)-3,5-dihydroxyphenylglycine transaminase
MRIARTDLSDALEHPIMSVMNFLNEVTDRHPSAVSFAPGRPASAFFGVERTGAWIERFVAHVAERRGLSKEAAWAWLGQYGPTNGVIGDLLAAHLERDHGIVVDARAIAVTHGAQEAMSILVTGLFRRDRDVLLVSEPCYIGMGGVARLAGVECVPVPAGPAGLDAHTVARAVADVRRRGKRPKALYDIPDFHNPLGTELPLSEREAILAVAKREDILVFEDNPYGMFAYDGQSPRTLKSLDTDRNVVYLGTFSKTMFPSVRVGYIVADQPYESGFLAEELSKVKSLLTVNTSQVSQALAGGILLENDCSLRALVAPRVAHYKKNRDAMLAALARELGGLAGVSWSRPKGGFFLTVALPFAMTDADVERCAAEHGVIVCPLRWFATSGRDREIRLSFSDTNPEAIAIGVARLGGFVRGR